MFWLSYECFSISCDAAITAITADLFPNTLVIMDERVLSFCAKAAVQILYCHFYYQYIN